jgi:hypothetical protein
MAPNPRQSVVSAGQSAGKAIGGTLDDARQFAEKAATRSREEAEDVLAEAKVVARKDTGRDAAVYVGLAATAAVGVIGLPLAAAAGAGYALFRRRNGR